jgi:thiamine-phosphate pyrophosphorylase
MSGRDPIGDLHVITDAALQDRFSHVALARMAVRGGASVVQFREKRLWTTRRLVDTATALGAVTAAGAVQLIVNDRVDVAAAVGAAGVHLGRSDLDPGLARTLLGTGAIIGGTANSLDEALRVAETDVDYLGAGPVYGTRSKADPAPPLGLTTLARMAESVAKPIIAIGTITADRVAEVMETGVHGVAVLSAVACDPRPEEAVRRFRDALDGCK